MILPKPDDADDLTALADQINATWSAVAECEEEHVAAREALAVAENELDAATTNLEDKRLALGNLLLNAKVRVKAAKLGWEQWVKDNVKGHGVRDCQYLMKVAGADDPAAAIKELRAEKAASAAMSRTEKRTTPTSSSPSEPSATAAHLEALGIIANEFKRAEQKVLLVMIKKFKSFSAPMQRAFLTGINARALPARGDPVVVDKPITPDSEYFASAPAKIPPVAEPAEEEAA